MMQKGDVVVVADDDDETERQQHCVLRHCSSGLSIYALSSYQRNESDSQHNTWSVSAGFTPPQLTLHAINRVYNVHTLHTIIFVTGEDRQSQIFSILAIQESAQIITLMVLFF
jgi:hypothetical protein